MQKDQIIAPSFGEGAHGKHGAVFALFLVFSRHLLMATDGNTWSWAERAQSLPYMAILVRSRSVRQHVLQGFCCSPFVCPFAVGFFFSCWVQENPDELFCCS